MEKRILVVESDPLVLDMLEKGLSLAGFQVNTSEGTDNILSLIEKFRPHLLVIAYILNGINGGELCRQVKTNFQTTNLPVILISGYPKILQSLGFYGCDFFLPKPVGIAELTNKVMELLETGPKTDIQSNRGNLIDSFEK